VFYAVQTELPVNRYHFLDQTSTDIESALIGMNTLTNELDAIDAGCDEARYQAYVEATTTLLEDVRRRLYDLRSPRPNR
jgi:hypothetical protein